MSYDPPRPAGRLLLTPEDKEAPARTERLRRLGLGERPEPTLDAFAYGLSEFTGAAYAMVNFLGQEGQFFAGLHTPAVAPVLRGDGTGALLGRSLPRDHGFCPHVVARRKALVLGDVSDYPGSRATRSWTSSGCAPIWVPRSSTAPAWCWAPCPSPTPGRGPGGRKGSRPSRNRPRISSYGSNAGRATDCCSEPADAGAAADGVRREGKLWPRLRNPRWTGEGVVRQIAVRSHPAPGQGCSGMPKAGTHPEEPWR